MFGLDAWKYFANSFKPAFTPLNDSTYDFGKLYSLLSPCAVSTTVFPSIASTFPASCSSLDLTFFWIIGSQSDRASHYYFSSPPDHLLYATLLFNPDHIRISTNPLGII